MISSRLALAAAAFGLLTSAVAAEPTQYPLTVKNCGQDVVFDAAPSKVVAIGQSGTEMLYALGLADRLAGTSVWFNEVQPRFKAQNDKVERLADNHPSFESVVAKEPQLVTTQFEFHVGPQGSVGTREQFNELGVSIYAMPADCVGKDNLVGGDGARKEAFKIDTVYQAIDELSTIFDVQDKGAELEKEVRDRVDAATEKAKALNLKDASAVVWFSSPDIDLDPFVAGQKGIAGYIMNTLGIKNVVDSDEEWPAVGWERIAQADPDIIVVARMDRRRFPADDHEVKIKFLKEDPVTREMTAVKENRIVVVDAHAIHASIRIADGIETISDALSKAGLSGQ
jgi:iron complex transport system substrate-binding protein